MKVGTNDRGRHLLLLILATLFCTCVRAQIVNIEDKRKGFDSIGWYGQIDLGGNYTKNINTVLSLNGAVRIDRKGKKQALLGLADYRLVRVGSDNALNAGFGHLRHAYYLSDTWRWETFGQIQYNEQIRLQMRTLVGTGPRLKLLSLDESRVYIGILYMYEYDEVAEGEIFYRSHRLSNYLSFNLYPVDLLSISNTTYYQPILPDFNQARLSSITTVEVKLTDRLAFTSKYSITHDALLNRGLPDVPETTYEWINGLRYTF